MNSNILQGIDKAREFFEIEKYPSNFFNLITSNKDYIDRMGIFLFKEDIDKLSGFIGYSKDERPIICINYKRPIGHQNFTLAHEIGHLFLHNGQSISDGDKAIHGASDRTDIRENEANQFASELLYPDDLVSEDCARITSLGYLENDKRVQLAEEINALCHKYCLSFDMVLRKILYKAYMMSNYKNIRKEIDKGIGKISSYFDKDFYVVNEEIPVYQQYMKPYIELKDKVSRLQAENKVGLATAESILYKYDLLES